MPDLERPKRRTTQLWLHHDRGTAEHLKQSFPNARLKLCPVSRNLHLAVRIPRVSKPTCAIKGQAVRRQPLNFERFPPALRNHRSFSICLGFFFVWLVFLTLRFCQFGFPEDCAPGRVIDDPALGCELGCWGGYGFRHVGSFKDMLRLGGRAYELGAVFENGGGHASITKVFAGLVRGKDEIDIIGSLGRLADMDSVLTLGMPCLICLVQSFFVVGLSGPNTVADTEFEVLKCKTLHDEVLVGSV